MCESARINLMYSCLIVFSNDLFIISVSIVQVSSISKSPLVFHPCFTFVATEICNFNDLLLISVPVLDPFFLMHTDRQIPSKVFVVYMQIPISGF